jgi:pyruvate/oxaloacetate carboxyltransferase
VEDEVEEALEEAEDRWYAITVNNQDTMQENVHFHLRHVCIVAHQIMTQKIVRHYWGRSRKRGIRTIRMFNGFLAEARDDGRNINIVTRGGAKIEMTQ